MPLSRCGCHTDCTNEAWAMAGHPRLRNLPSFLSQGHVPHQGTSRSLDMATNISPACSSPETSHSQATGQAVYTDPGLASNKCDLWSWASLPCWLTKSCTGSCN